MIFFRLGSVGKKNYRKPLSGMKAFRFLNLNSKSRQAKQKVTRKMNFPKMDWAMRQSKLFLTGPMHTDTNKRVKVPD